MEEIRIGIMESKIAAHEEALSSLELKVDIYHKRLGIVEQNTEDIKHALLGDYKEKGFITDYKEHKKRCDDIQAEKEKVKQENRGQWLGLKMNFYTMVERAVFVGLFIWIFKLLNANSDAMASVLKAINQ